MALAMAGTSCDTENKGAIYDASAVNVSFETPAPALITTENPSATTKVRIIRANKQGAFTAHYTAQASEDGIFTDDANGTISFADGEAVKEITVNAANMEKGVTYTYTMTLDDATMAVADTVTKTANRTVKVSILCDYNWLAAGTCSITDATWYEDPLTHDDIPIQHAEGTDIYRIVSPLYYLYNGKEKDPDKSHLQFTLNSDKSITIEDGVHLNWWGYNMYYDTANYGSYCYIEQEDNTYAVNFLLLNGSDLYTGGYFEFTWNGRP